MRKNQNNLSIMIVEFENYLYQDDVSKIPQELSEYLQKLINSKFSSEIIKE